MPKAIAEASGWKRHRCVDCNSRFRYLLHAQGTSIRPTLDEARVDAKAKAERQLDWDIARVPCPKCGIFQPEMLRRKRTIWLRLMLGAGIFSGGLVGALALFRVVAQEVAGPTLPGGVVGTFLAHFVHEAPFYLVAVWWLAVLVVHVIVLRRSPNRDPEMNLIAFQEMISDGTLALMEAGGPNNTDMGPAARAARIAPLHALLLLAILSGIAISIIPPLVRFQQGWRLNAAWQSPVTGPGDTARVHFPQQVRSLRGLWRGSAAARIQNAAALGIDDATIPASSRAIEWDSKIKVKHDELSTKSHP